MSTDLCGPTVWRFRLIDAPSTSLVNVSIGSMAGSPVLIGTQSGDPDQIHVISEDRIAWVQAFRTSKTFATPIAVGPKITTDILSTIKAKA